MNPERPDSGGADIHQEFQILMMGSLDGELEPEQERRLKDHVSACAACARELAQYQRLQTIAREVRLREPADHEWIRFRQRLYNRLERCTAWLLIVLGGALVAGGSMYSVLRTTLLPPLVRAGIAVAAAGLLWLFLHVVRERRATRSFDRYREIRR